VKRVTSGVGLVHDIVAAMIGWCSADDMLLKLLAFGIFASPGNGFGNAKLAALVYSKSK